VTIELRILYFLVKLRIIFHSTYENGQFDRKTAIYTRNFQEISRKSLLFDQEKETGNGFFRPGIRAIFLLTG